MRRNGHAFPDLMWPEVAQHGLRAANVIGVTVCEDECVNRSHSKRAQRRRHNALTNVERRARLTTCIDQQGSAVRESDQRRISLPYIKKNNTQNTRLQTLCTNICGKRRRHEHHVDHGHNAPSRETPGASIEEQAAATVVESDHPPGRRDDVLRSPWGEVDE